MAAIYSISDIHGCYKAMKDTLQLVDLDIDKDNSLIVLGDYVDGGIDSCQVLYDLKELEEMYPQQVIILLGNHDKMFIDWFTTLNDQMQWLMHDFNLLTIKSFFSTEQFSVMEKQPEMTKGSYMEISKYIVEKMMENHSDLLHWLSNKEKTPPYYETESQIYVHAGICEDDEKRWKHATKPSEFFWKYPAETGFFSKDIIAGHVSAMEVAGDKRYLGRVFWDGASHFFIDGEVVKSNTVPLLEYNTNTKVYTSYEKQQDGLWSQYKIT